MLNKSLFSIFFILGISTFSGSEIDFGQAKFRFLSGEIFQGNIKKEIWGGIHEINAERNEDSLTLSIKSEANLYRESFGNFEITEDSLKDGWKEDPITLSKSKEILPKDASIFYLTLLSTNKYDYTIIPSNRYENLRIQFENIKEEFIRKHGEDRFNELIRTHKLYTYKEDILANKELIDNLTQNIDYLLKNYSHKLPPNTNKRQSAELMHFYNTFYFIDFNKFRGMYYLLGCAEIDFSLKDMKGREIEIGGIEPRRGLDSSYSVWFILDEDIHQYVHYLTISSGSSHLFPVINNPPIWRSLEGVARIRSVEMPSQNEEDAPYKVEVTVRKRESGECLE